MTTVPNFTVSQKEFAKAMGVAMAFINSRMVLEVAKGFLITADAISNTVRITATDLTKTLTLEVEAKVAVGCTMCLPAARISAAMTELPEGTIEVTADQEKNAATFKTKAAKVRLTGHDPDDYPIVADSAGAVNLTLPAVDLHKALKSVALFASDEDARTNLTVVHVSYKNDGRLLLAATDSYRLMFRYVSAPNAATVGNITVNIPAESVTHLVRLLAASREHDVTLAIGENGVFASIVNRDKQSWVRATFHTLLKDVRYPDFWMIVPKTHKARLGFKVKDLVQALRVVGTISKIGIDQVTFTHDGDNTVLTAKDGYAGEGVFTLTNAETEGEPCQMTLRRWYLEEALGWFDGDDIVYLQTTDPTKPLVVLDRTPDDGQIIIMPMQV